MGVYNVVKILLPCPKCGVVQGEFQTKDDAYEALYLESVEFYTCREFHTICDSCNTYISVKLKESKLKELTINDYDIIAVPLGEIKEIKLNETNKNGESL